MTSTLLNIAGKIDLETVAVFEIVCRAISALDIPYVVVGATARDLVLHHGHGAKIQRATHDIDFAIEIPNWAAFNALRDRLCAEGFKTTHAQHRLISPLNTEVDIVPFGQVEDKQASIAWPPKGEIVMNVLGFQEACDSAEWVRIQETQS
ncbi:MAG: nucleotidyl transferase AbiEii/AbiGii toxin family protein [Ectothiorhodospiraceae bacterium]|nr:nucleotidyl transferase AbiEii/AbiGii toxin family protein [Ectothiorhodospiraceae bacterium]